MKVTIVSENNVVEYMEVMNVYGVCSTIAKVISNKYKQSKANQCIIQSRCNVFNPKVSFVLIYNTGANIRHVEYIVSVSYVEIIKDKFNEMINNIKGFVDEISRHFKTKVKRTI